MLKAQSELGYFPISLYHHMPKITHEMWAEISAFAHETIGSKFKNLNTCLIDQVAKQEDATCHLFNWYLTCTVILNISDTFTLYRVDPEYT